VPLRQSDENLDLYIIILLFLTWAHSCLESDPAVREEEGNSQSVDSGKQSPGFKTVVDSRGKEVLLPENPLRVATVSDALVEELMIVLGVEDRIVGIGSTCLIREFSYRYESASGDIFSFQGGMNPALFLRPQLKTLPLFVRPGTEINYETLAGLNPDVLIIDQGACTLPWRTDRELQERGLSRLESLGIPTILLKGINCTEPPRLEALSDVIRILGEVFNQTDKAARLAKYLEDSVQWVFDRTRDVGESERPEVLLLGLDPLARAQGTVGNVYGKQDVHSYFVERIGAKNAFPGNQNVATLSLEQLYAIDPDVIILPTANGYHPPRELYEVGFFQKLQPLKAIRDRRAGSLPWSPCNCDKRLEYPVDIYVIAKIAFPELFQNLNLAEKTLRLYQDVYGVDRQTALGILDAQWMDWILEGEDRSESLHR